MVAQIPTLIIDFDSTLVTCEALDELAALCLHKSPKRDAIVGKIKDITARGMEGKISIHDSLTERLKLIRATKDDIETLIRLLQKRITPSFARNRAFLKKHADRVYVITSGFREYVIPVIKTLGLKDSQVLANTFRFDRVGRVAGFDVRNPLAHDKGKLVALHSLGITGDVVVIGDGYTDFQMKETGLVKTFYAFVENVERLSVVQGADVVIRSFDEFLYLNRLPMKFSYPKSKIQVLLLENIHAHAVSAFKHEGFNVESIPNALDESELVKRIKNVSFLGIRSKTKVSERVVAHAPKLLGIGAFCIGTDQVELDTCAGRGVAVFNAPYSNTRSVVELTFGEIIMLMRQAFELSTQLHRGRWLKTASGSFEVRGRKLGIIGYGNIGSQLSVLAESFGMEVYYYDIIEKLSLGNAKRCKTMQELLKLVDVVTVHVDGRASNQGLLGQKEFQCMKDGVIFLNLSRGSVVDLAALATNLKKGKVAGAGLDVYPEEPKGNEEEFRSELRGLPNVILTPHIGGSTVEAQRNIAEYVSSKIVDYLNTGSSFGSVNFPNIQLPTLHRAHRLLHVHRNVPGILAKINSILARHKINILGQYLKTTEQIGYVISDVNKRYDRKVISQLEQIPDTIRFRVLY